MELKLKLLKWSAGVPVAMLNKETAEKMGAHLRDRISIKAGSKEISTIVDTIGKLVKKNEIAVSTEVRERLKLKPGIKVDVNILPPCKTLSFIKNKLNNKSLSQKEISEIIKDITNNNLSETEIALFITAMHKNGMSKTETIFLINAILKTGNKLKLKSKYVVDKHSIGGIPGNRTTPIVVSICAAAGLTMPKNSSRAITSAAGTADVIETIARIDFSIKEIKKIIKKTNACLVWGGGLGMVPADSKIIQTEKKLKIDPEAQLLASIMSKKLAVGSKYILIDIPYGKTAKVNKSKALKLKKKFEELGRHFKRKLKVVLTDGSQPIGIGIGPALELKDILTILDPKQQGSKDLEEKSVFLASELLEMTGKAKTNKGEGLAREILNSGKAFEKFKQIIKAQQGKIPKTLKKAKFKKTIKSKKDFKIKEIDNKKINNMARIAGCPIDKSAGLQIHVKINDKIKKTQLLLTIYAESKSRLNQAIKFYKKEKPIR